MVQQSQSCFTKALLGLNKVAGDATVDRSDKCSSMDYRDACARLCPGHLGTRNSTG